MKASASKVKTNTLVITSDDPAAHDLTPAQRIARHASTVAVVQAAVGMEPWLTHSVGEPDFTALAEKIREQADAMHSGDMKGIESMLFAQALTLPDCLALDPAGNITGIDGGALHLAGHSTDGPDHDPRNSVVRATDRFTISITLRSVDQGA